MNRVYPRHREENISPPPPPSPFNYYLIYVKQIYEPVWGPIFLNYSLKSWTNYAESQDPHLPTKSRIRKWCVLVERAQFGSPKPDVIFLRMRSESARCVLHFIPSFMYPLCLAYGRNQSWSFRCRCVSTATQKLHRGMWTKSYAHIPPALFPDSFIKFLRMTTFAVSYFFICFFYFLSNSFGETDFPNGGACCLHTGGRNGRVHCLLDSSDNCNGFFHWKTFSKRKHLSTHVALNSGSVKLSHELSDLLC